MTANTDFVFSVIGSLSGTVQMGVVEAQLVVDDAIEVYGVSDEDDATDTVKLNALLRYFAWSKVRDELLLDPSAYKTDSESFQFAVERLDKRVAEARSKAAQYLPESQIDQGRLDYPDDPYSISGQIEHAA